VIPGVIAFVLIAGAVFACLKLWHESRLPEVTPMAPTVASPADAEADLTYQREAPLTVGARYRTGRVLRVLSGESPAALPPAALDDLWTVKDGGLTLIARGQFDVLECLDASHGEARWYRVRIPEDCLLETVPIVALDAWLEDTQLLGATLIELDRSP